MTNGSYNLLGTETPVVQSQTADQASVEVGVSFTSSQAGAVTAIRYFRGKGNNGYHTGRLYSSNGTRLASIVFTGETATGWQTATLATPVKLTPGSRYVVSYLAPQGKYSYTTNYFATAKTTGPLTMGATTNGLYRYGSTGGFPTSSWKATNYFVDAVFKPEAAPAPAPAPTPTPAPTATPAPSPTPAPTPTPAPEPTPAPAPGTWPSASTTGVPSGTVLTSSGALNVTTAGTVLQGLNINGNVRINAANVTIKNSKITGKVEVYGGNVALQRVEIVGPGVSGAHDSAVNWADYSCDGCNVHGWGKAFYMEDNVTIKNSWVHDLTVSGDPATTGSHNEAIFTQGGSNFIITGNRLDSGTAPNFSAAIALYGQQRAVNNALVQGNLLNGGGFCLYAGYDAGIPPINARFIDNTFGNSAYANCGKFGPATAYYAGNGNQWTGNVMANGTAVAAPR